MGNRNSQHEWRWQGHEGHVFTNKHRDGPVPVENSPALLGRWPVAGPTQLAACPRDRGLAGASPGSRRCALSPRARLNVLWLTSPGHLQC